MAAKAIAPGFPRELTKRRHEKIVEAVRGGKFYSHAARKSGIHPDTLREWRRQGEEDEKAGAKTACAALSAAVARAREEWEDQEFESIGDAVDKRGVPDWRARAYRLAVMNPRRFSEKRSLELSGTVKAEAVFSDEQNEAIVREGVACLDEKDEPEGGET